MSERGVGGPVSVVITAAIVGGLRCHCFVRWWNLDIKVKREGASFRGQRQAVCGFRAFASVAASGWTSGEACTSIHTITELRRTSMDPSFMDPHKKTWTLTLTGQISYNIHQAQDSSICVYMAFILCSATRTHIYNLVPLMFSFHTISYSSQSHIATHYPWGLSPKLNVKCSPAYKCVVLL